MRYLWFRWSFGTKGLVENVCIQTIGNKKREVSILYLTSDMIIKLTDFYPKQYYLEPFRLVRDWNDEQNREFIFLTNQAHISAIQVAKLYKNHWQVELFFKWLKQHLKIKKFWCTSENVVRIQIYAAVCCYWLVAVVQEYMRLGRSTYEILQVLSISLADKTHSPRPIW